MHKLLVLWSCEPGVYQRSGAGNWHFCNMLARIEDHINIILYFFTGNAIQSCYGCVKSTGGRNKNGIFRVHSEKWQKQAWKWLLCGPSLCFASHVCTESAIFARLPYAVGHVSSSILSVRHATRVTHAHTNIFSTFIRRACTRRISLCNLWCLGSQRRLTQRTNLAN